MKITSLYYDHPNDVSYSVENFKIILSEIEYSTSTEDMFNPNGEFDHTRTEYHVDKIIDLVNTDLVEDDEYLVEEDIILEQGKKYAVTGTINGKQHPRYSGNKTFDLVNGIQVTLENFWFSRHKTTEFNLYINESDYIYGLANFKFSLYNSVDYYDCDGNCLNDADSDGVCDELEGVILGCTDDSACNYDASATEDDDSCVELQSECDSCSDDGLSVIDNDDDDDNVCNEGVIFGCTNDSACNYDTEATANDASCTYAEKYYSCDGTCINDLDNDEICDEVDDLVECLSEYDECGVCGGDNSSCTDCSGVINGSAKLDFCNQCVGGYSNKSSCEDGFDLNKDGTVNILDILILLTELLYMEEEYEIDFNKDGQNNIIDVMILINYVISQ